MIICKSKGFILLKVPKTASTSLYAHLHNNIHFQENDSYFSFALKEQFKNEKIDFIAPKNIPGECFVQHPNLQYAIDLKILNNEEINSMDVYGVMREPISRTISLFFHALRTYIGGLNSANISRLTTNNIVELVLDRMMRSSTPYTLFVDAKKSFPLYCQTSWLMHNEKPINNIIIYPHFQNFLKKIDVNPNFTEKLIVAPPFKNIELRDDLKKEIMRFYKKDFELWEQITSKSS